MLLIICILLFMILLFLFGVIIMLNMQLVQSCKIREELNSINCILYNDIYTWMRNNT